MPFLDKLTKRDIGDFRENQAQSYLTTQGLKLVDKNFHCRHGELDLIMTDEQNSTLVIVEVRYRKNTNFGGAAASITKSKQDKIKKTALFFIAQRKITLPVRFDIVAIEGEDINWISNAFV